MFSVDGADGHWSQIPRETAELKLSSWLLIKHDLVSNSAVSLIFDDAPYFFFLCPISFI